MTTIITISTWTDIIHYFLPIFTIPTAEIFARLVTGWVLCTAKHTITGILPFADPQGKEKDDFFFTTDLEMTAAEVIGGFAGRWSIEDTFKNTKQFLRRMPYGIGGQEPQVWKGKGPERAAVLSLWLYSVIWLWFLQQRKSQKLMVLLPWYPAKAHPSFQDALACLRRVLWRQRIKFMFGKTFVHDKIFEFLITALSTAA